MEINENEEMKRLLESQHEGVFPPQYLKARVFATIELMKTLKELSLLYTGGLLYALGRSKREGGK